MFLIISDKSKFLKLKIKQIKVAIRKRWSHSLFGMAGAFKSKQTEKYCIFCKHHGKHQCTLDEFSPCGDGVGC